MSGIRWNHQGSEVYPRWGCTWRVFIFVPAKLAEWGTLFENTSMGGRAIVDDFGNAVVIEALS